MACSEGRIRLELSMVTPGWIGREPRYVRLREFEALGIDCSEGERINYKIHYPFFSRALTTSYRGDVIHSIVCWIFLLLVE
jgi:hypothetical protein